MFVCVRVRKRHVAGTKFGQAELAADASLLPGWVSFPRHALNCCGVASLSRSSGDMLRSCTHTYMFVAGGRLLFARMTASAVQCTVDLLY